MGVLPLITKCDLFKNNPGLVIVPSRLQSAESLKDFQDFVSKLEDKAINITDKNFPDCRSCPGSSTFRRWRRSSRPIGDRRD
jgi:hypothetical protein